MLQFQKAEAELAYALQVAKTKQRIVEEKMQIKVVERQQEISIQEQEIQRKQKELDAIIRRPAEAEKYRYVDEPLVKIYRAVAVGHLISN